MTDSDLQAIGAPDHPDPGNCAVLENIHTYPMEGHWKFQGGGGFQKPKFLKESMELTRGGGFKPKKTHSMGGVWIFAGTTQHKNKVGLNPTGVGFKELFTKAMSGLMVTKLDSASGGRG